MTHSNHNPAPSTTRRIGMRHAAPVLATLAMLAPILHASAQQNPDTLPRNLPMSSLDLDMTQDAWNAPTPNKHADQSKPGYKLLPHSWDSIHRIRIRVATTVSVRLDPTESIDTFLLADTAIIEATAVPPNGMELRALQAGADTSLSIYTHSGRLYKLYLATVPHDSDTTTDFIVDIPIAQPRSVPPPHSPAGPHTPDPDPAPSALQTVGRSAATTPSTKFLAASQEHHAASQLATPAATGIFGNLESKGADIAALRYDLTAYASTEAAKHAIGPQRVFRDQRWTYVDFGPRAALMEQWPAATILTSETESPVATDIAGPNRNILIVKAIGSIVLRSGPHVICIDLKTPPDAGPPPQPPQPTAADQPLLQPPAPLQADNTQAVAFQVTSQRPAELDGVLASALSGQTGITWHATGENTVQINGMTWPNALALCSALTPHEITCSFTREN